MKRLLLVFFLFQLQFASVHSQDVNIPLNEKPYPIWSDGQRILIAGSLSSGLYNEGIGLELSNLNGNNIQSIPELLVLYDFLYKKEGNMNSLLELYDPGSRDLARSIINITKAQSAYSLFNNFDLLSKNVFANYVRIRFTLISSDENKYPWVLMIKKTGERYFLNSTLPAENLFVLAASMHPYNLTREDYLPADVTNMMPLYFEMVNDTAKESGGISGSDLKLFFSIDKVNAIPPDAIGLLNNMADVLKHDRKDDFVRLWVEEERQNFYDDEYYHFQYINFRDYFQKVINIIPLGFMNSENESIIFYKTILNDNNFDYHIISIKLINGSYYLSPELENTGVWALINDETLKKSLFSKLDK